MIFRELSNAAFRFSLRRPGAEIMGGGVQTPPPPPAGGGKSRGPAGRGLWLLDENNFLKFQSSTPPVADYVGKCGPPVTRLAPAVEIP